MTGAKDNRAMQRPPSMTFPPGRVERTPHVSQCLRGNRWNDPTERALTVYLPAGYRDGDVLPLLVSLAGYTSSGLAHVNWRAFEESLPERLDRLIGSGAMAPAVVLFPDCFTTLGGNQYLNSSALGAYADYLLTELIPETESRYGTDRNRRAVFGKSSGGYGALMLAMRYPGAFHAVASHAGDVGFETLFRSSFPSVATTLRDYVRDPDLSRFIKKFWGARKVGGADIHALMMLGMAASFDPDPAEPLGFKLPFDLRTCVVDPVRWRRWLEHDPLVLIERAARPLSALKALYIDVGTRDEYHIQYGTRLLHDRLTALGVPHHFEEFDGTHSAMDHRLDLSLPLLRVAL
jgi:enterochelin esterase-like enzyme